MFAALQFIIDIDYFWIPGLEWRRGGIYMHYSAERMLTTHVGSLPRGERLLQMLVDREAGTAIDEAAFEKQVKHDLDYVLQKQAEVGVDIIGDGELPRLGFSFYVKDRMSGFGGHSPRGTVTDFAKFPGYARLKQQQAAKGDEISKSATLYAMPECQCAVQYDTEKRAAQQELRLFTESLERTGVGNQATATFVTAATPGIVSTTLLRNPNNPDYATDRDYVMALAEELRSEYELIVEHGHILQVDGPDLALERQILYVDKPLDAFLKRVELHVEALNAALINIPKDRVRLHVCWGNWDGPHIDDMDLEPLLPLLYQANVGGLSIPFANPRHQHEGELFVSYPLPDDMLLFPGVVDVTTNYLEHPEVVAERLARIVDVVGERERIIASTDCGFSTFAGYTMVAEDVVWAKLQVLSQGAALASERLW